MKIFKNVIFSFLVSVTCSIHALAEIKAVELSTPILNPQIQFKETLHDFKRIKTGEKAIHIFEFKNIGGSDLIIYSIKPTCGCTGAIASTGPYRPGELGTIKVEYDSRAKTGFAQKDVTVESNDPKSPHSLRMEGLVLGDNHPTVNSADVLFTGSCVECHSMPAKGKKGKELYDAVCYLCHDLPQASGKKPIAPDQETLAQLSKRELKKVTSKGMPKTTMPGFSHKAGGPLSEEQIESLLEYFKSIKKK
ncbi:MAG: DUF1573 domain-containing protein [Elusimicrobia bacterium]|nr:DUF1573 domain-containing protein [Elusimicrobiota bacterium]